LYQAQKIKIVLMAKRIKIKSKKQNKAACM